MKPCYSLIITLCMILILVSCSYNSNNPGTAGVNKTLHQSESTFDTAIDAHISIEIVNVLTPDENESIADVKVTLNLRQT